MVCSPSVNDEPSRPRDKPQLEFLASAIDGKITRSRYLHSYIRDRTPRNNNGQPDDKIAAIKVASDLNLNLNNLCQSRARA